MLNNLQSLTSNLEQFIIFFCNIYKDIQVEVIYINNNNNQQLTYII